MVIVEVANELHYIGSHLNFDVLVLFLACEEELEDALDLCEVEFEFECIGDFIFHLQYDLVQDVLDGEELRHLDGVLVVNHSDDLEVLLEQVNGGKAQPSERPEHIDEHPLLHHLINQTFLQLHDHMQGLLHEELMATLKDKLRHDGEEVYPLSLRFPLTREDFHQ